MDHFLLHKYKSFYFEKPFFFSFSTDESLG